MNVFNPEQTASLLVGLRLLQHYNDGTDPDSLGIGDILDSGGEVTPLTNEEIDLLCMDLNSQGITHFTYAAFANLRADRDGWMELAHKLQSVVEEKSKAIVTLSDKLADCQENLGYAHGEIHE